VYNASTGALVTSNFINTSGATGIAFDGTDFFVSNIFNSSLSEYDSTGAFVKTINITGAPSIPGGDGTLIEDLSVDYNLVIPPSATPEPSSLMLLGTGVLGLVGGLRRRFANA
jgi:hypothetical protein